MTSYKSTRVVIDGELRPATVRAEGGAIVSIDDGAADHDLGDMALLPGLVDSHVHVNDPGRADWEGFESATRAARAGGTTTIVDMPLNSIPPTTSVAALEEKRRAAEGRIHCHVAFWGGVVPGSERHIDALEEAGVCGFKVFLTDSGVPEFPPMPDVSRLPLRTPLLVHAESDSHLSTPRDGSYGAYLDSRPPAAERVAIEGLYTSESATHVLHVSSGEAVEAIGAGPARMTAETCPHYLTFTVDDVDGTEFKCAPPIRTADDREALWDGLRQGVISMVVSDHSPSPPSMKEGDFATAWGGISSVQLRLVATWAGAEPRGFGLPEVVEWLAAEPARLAGLDDRKGAIEVGRDADLVVFDPEGETVVRGSDLAHRHHLTPYDGMRLQGSVVDTILGSPARMLNRK